jgi:hypothetical protein
LDWFAPVGGRFEHVIDPSECRRRVQHLADLLVFATKSLSCHLYGTTVDISYKNFFNTKTDTLESSWEAIQAMTKVLVEMRKECKLLAVRERHQSCFHITVVCCKPEPKKEEE